MVSTNWELYTELIIKLHEKGYNSTQILESLHLVHSGIEFPSSAGRTIRKIISKHKARKLQKNFYKEEKHTAKILLLDIETAPMVAYLWSKWQNGISDDFIISDWFVLSWAAKWLFEEEVLSDKLTAEELLQKDDQRIIVNIWELLDKADIVIAHNLHKFDEKKLKTRFLKHGLKTPSPYQTIDTLLHLRKQFGITSNKLDYVARNFLEIEGKMETPKGLWQRCMEGDYSALELMDDYCQQDVRVLEEVYLRIRGWIKPHPNLALFAVSDDRTCPACGSEDNEKTLTDYVTYVNIYEAYRCTNCSHTYRSRKALTTGKKAVGVSLPK